MTVPIEAVFPVGQLVSFEYGGGSVSDLPKRDDYPLRFRLQVSRPRLYPRLPGPTTDESAPFHRRSSVERSISRALIRVSAA